MSMLAIVHVVVLLALVISALVVGVGMLFRPTQRRYEMLRPITWASLLASSSAMCAGFSSTAVRLAAETSWTPQIVQHAWAGLAEALVPGTFGFGLLAVAWGLAAIGLRRLD